MSSLVSSVPNSFKAGFGIGEGGEVVGAGVNEGNKEAEIALFVEEG